jgi:competence protein ComEA
MKFLTILFFSAIVIFASVDINNATAEEFTSIKGIGLKKAQSVIEYRDTIKCFKSIDELTNVKGIGKSTLDKNKANLTLGKCKKEKKK